MIKLKIIDIKDNNYKLQNEKIYQIPFIFYGNQQPKIGDTIYISTKILNETNIYNFGPINNENLNQDELMKVVNNEKEYYLQQYYG